MWIPEFVMMSACVSRISSLYGVSSPVVVLGLFVRLS